MSKIRLFLFVVAFFCFYFMSEGKSKSNRSFQFSEGHPYNDSVLVAIRDGYEQRRAMAFEQLRSKPLVRKEVRPPVFSDGSNFSREFSYSLVDFAFKCFWLNEQIDVANAALLENANYYIGYPAAYKDKDSFYWAADELCRILEYFGSRGTIRTGLVTKEIEERIFLMMWQYSKMQSKVAKAEYKISKTWYVEESENHHIQRFYAAWHFAKFLKDQPQYNELKYDDGFTAAEHYAAWNDYIKQWIPERAKKGLFVEMANDGYGLETLKGVYNFYDFADDQQLRQLSGKLLDLYWAAWAQEQLSGVRGGGKSRIYPDGSAHGRTAFWKMAWYYLGMNEMNVPKGNLFTLVTSSYRMPLVVMDIALDAAGRGDYEIVQRNPGLAEDGFYTPKPSYHLQENGGLIRYGYCTPNFIMGSLACEARRYEDWAMIRSQNRWMGIIYNENPDARIFPLCKTGEDKRAYNQMWAVQKKGTMIVQKLKNQLHSRGAGEMQVWISREGLSSPVEMKGWVFVDCGESFTAIKPVNGGYKWLDEKAGKWMVCANQYTPVIFEVVPKSACPSMTAFQEKIIANSYSLENNVLHYNSLDGNLLTLPTDYKGLPSVNGKEVILAPDLVWDSPFIGSKFNSGIVKIQKGVRTLNLDFLENSQAQSAPLKLDASQAKGGEIIQTDRGTSAVLFPATAPVNDNITWAIDGSLPVGLWQVDLDFYQPESSFSPNQLLCFEGADGERLATLDLYYTGFTKGTYIRSFGFYSSKSVSAIALLKNAQRNINTVAVRSIRILPATSASLEKLQAVFQLPVSGQQVALPFPLQLGVYLVNSAKPVALNWISPEGNTFSTPLNSEVRVFIDQNTQPSLISGEPVAFIQLTHYPTTVCPDMTSAGNLPLTVVVDSTKIETRTLKLIGYRGGEMPKVDLFPSGKSMAVVTSWDDGQAMDVQVMECLSKYGMKGTFYMNRGSAMNTRLDELEAKGMEIGSHSWSHPPFYNSSPDRCLAEAVEMRRYLEKIHGHPVISFAYPYVYQPAYDAGGDYVLRSLRQAGYWSGRTTTTGDNRIDSIPNPMAMRPNFHFKVGAAKTKEKLDELLQKPGSILYLWGHSYELAGDGTKILEEVLASVANHPEVWYANLGELMTWQFTRNHLQIEQASTKGGGKSFTLKMPWLHPWLRKVPVSLTVPDGVTEVLWQGKPIPVVNRRVQLVW